MLTIVRVEIVILSCLMCVIVAVRKKIVTIKIKMKVITIFHILLIMVSTFSTVSKRKALLYKIMHRVHDNLHYIN